MPDGAEGNGGTDGADRGGGAEGAGRMPETGFSIDDLRADFETLDIEAGDEVVVHSSLSSIGWVDGGADAVVDALVETVGETGTVVVPTFTSEFARHEPFDPDTTPSQTGAVTEALRKRPAAVRSAHPTHSVAAIGPAAPTLTADHAYLNSLGRDSPLHRLALRGGKILLVGVGNERNSSLHVAEALSNLPYKAEMRTAYVLGDTGERREVETSRVGNAAGFPKLDPLAACRGAFTRGTVGDANATVMRGDEILEIAQEVLRDHPAFLLCDDPDCWWCPDARRQVADSERGSD